MISRLCLSILLCLLLSQSVASAQSSFSGGYTSQPSIASIPMLSSQLSAFPAGAVTVCNRSEAYDNGFSIGTDIQSTGCTSATYRRRVVVLQSTPCLVIEYGNWGKRVTATDHSVYAGANSIQVKASVEHTENGSQVVIPGYGLGTGQETITIDPGGKGYIVVFGPFTAGEVIFVRTYVTGGTNRTVTDGAMTSGSFTLTSATASFTSADVGRWVTVAGAGSGGVNLVAQIAQVNSSTSVGISNSNASGGNISGETVTLWDTWPTSINLDPTSGTVNPNGGGSAEGATANTDLTGVTTAVGAHYVADYGPLDILGYPSTSGTGRVTVALLGDSIMRGIHLYTDQGNTFVQAALQAAGVGVKNLSISGETVADVVTASGLSTRWSMLNGCTALVVNLGTNGLYSYNETPDVDWADLQTLCAYAHADGIQNVCLIDLPPRTTSTDNFLTVTNQSVYTTTVSSTVSTATNATPIVVTTSAAHHWISGEQVVISGVTGNSAANGTFYVSVLSSSTAALYSDVNLTSAVAGTGAGTGGTATVTYEQEREALDAEERLGWRTAGFREFIDADATLAVNSSGAASTISASTGFPNGLEYWPAPSSPAITESTGAGITSSSSGSSWLGDTGTALTSALTSNYKYDYYTLQITAGSGSPTTAAVVTSLTGSPPKLYVKNGSGVAWTVLPDTTTNYKVWNVYTADGTHPSPYAGASALQAIVPVAALSTP